MFVTVLSDKAELRAQFLNSFGDASPSEEISFYVAEQPSQKHIIVEPALFPSKIQSLLHSLAIADYVVLIVDQLTLHIGEIIIALDALKKDRGIIVSSLNLPIGATVLAKYEKTADISVAKAKLLELQSEQDESEFLGLIDKTLNMQGTGNIAHGIVKTGKLKKSDSYFLLPEKKEVSVRTLKIHGNETEEALAGDRFEIVYKGDLSERGLLVPLRNSLELTTSIQGTFTQSPFFKEDLNHKIHAYHNFQFVEGRVSDTELILDKPIAYAKGDRILVIDASNQKLRIAGAFVSRR